MKKFVAALLLAGLAGCGLLWDDPYVTVTVTPLNWVEIHYYNTNYEPVKRTSVRITGLGRVEVKTGSSMLISDDFAKRHTEDTWDDLVERTIQADPEYIRNLFQSLVNQGLFDREKNFRGADKNSPPPPGKFIAVRAAIDNKTFSEPTNIFETDPDLAEALLAVVDQFKVVPLGGQMKSRRKPPQPPAMPAKP